MSGADTGSRQGENGNCAHSEILQSDFFLSVSNGNPCGVFYFRRE